MKVTRHGVTKTWQPPDKIICSACTAQMEEITLADLKVYEWEDGDQRDSYTAYGLCVVCPDCGARNDIKNAPQLVVEAQRRIKASINKKPASNSYWDDR